MKQLLSFIRKEFNHMLRDRKTLLILFALPVIEILIFGFALTNEVKNSRVLLLDQAHDPTSQRIITRIEASHYFDIDQTTMSYAQVEAAFKKGKIKMAIVIPAHLDEDLRHLQRANVQLIVDASDPNTANTITNYVTAILRDEELAFNAEKNVEASIGIRPEVKMLYNPQLKGAPNFVPGVMALVLMIISVTMTAISIVLEKENGTMEILLVSPFTPAFVILSKCVPYLVLSLLNITSILLLSVFVLDLPIAGSLWLLYAESMLFIFTCLTLGIFISIRTSTQQAAMLISMMGMLLPTMILSGFMFPIENMPVPLQWVSNIIPAKWYYIIVKSIMIKGLSFSAIWKETLVLVGITFFFFGISLKLFKIRLT